jgi:hypothetical protein
LTLRLQPESQLSLPKSDELDGLPALLLSQAEKSLPERAFWKPENLLNISPGGF